MFCVPGRVRSTLAVVLFVVVAGCGVQPGERADEALPVREDGGQTSSEERRSQEESLDAALDQAVDLGTAGADLELTDDEQDCFVDGLDAEGIDLDTVMTDMDAEDERVAFFRVLLDCMEHPDENVALVDNLTATFGAGIGLSDLSSDEGGCLLRRILEESDDPARTLVAGDGPKDAELFEQIAQDCLTAAHLDEISGAPGTGPQTYGDDPGLDVLQDACEAGDPRACDLLYLLSSEDSDYEEVGATCAGAQPEADVFCSEDVAVDDSGAAPEDFPGLEVLATDCRDGDFIACDLLYQIAPLDSDAETVGFTCGGRIAVGALPDCRTRFG